jgi:hypothetical protein
MLNSKVVKPNGNHNIETWVTETKEREGKFIRTVKSLAPYTKLGKSKY